MTVEQIKAIGSLSNANTALGTYKRIADKLDTVIANQEASPATQYTHKIVMTGTSEGSYFATKFFFTNTVNTEYTTLRQVADALRALGYEERNGVSATGVFITSSGLSRHSEENRDIDSVCAYSASYCNGDSNNLSQLNFLDSENSLILAVSDASESVILSDVATVSSSAVTSGTSHIVSLYGTKGGNNFRATFYFDDDVEDSYDTVDALYDAIVNIGDDGCFVVMGGSYDNLDVAWIVPYNGDGFDTVKLLLNAWYGWTQAYVVAPSNTSVSDLCL